MPNALQNREAMMTNLHKRVGELERGCNGLCLVLVSQRSDNGRETASYQGHTYTREPGETAEQFRTRLIASCKSAGRLLLLSEQDEAL